MVRWKVDTLWVLGGLVSNCHILTNMVSGKSKSWNEHLIRRIQAMKLDFFLLLERMEEARFEVFHMTRKESRIWMFPTLRGQIILQEAKVQRCLSICGILKVQYYEGECRSTLIWSFGLEY